MTTIDRFHLSDSMSENAAYQLISSRICQKRGTHSTKSLSAAKLYSLQYMPILNSHCHCSRWPGLATNNAHRNYQKVICVE